MSEYLGADLSPANVRWCHDSSEEGMIFQSCPRLCGCPPLSKDDKPEYDSIDTWGNSLAFRGHDFSRTKGDNGQMVDHVAGYLFADYKQFTWLHRFFSRDCPVRPPISPEAVFTAAIPNALPSRLQDEALANMPESYGKTYLLWRPIAIALDWLEDIEAHFKDPGVYLGRRVFILDLDGGLPEVSEIGICRHSERWDKIIPVRKSPRRGCRSSDDWNGDALAGLVLASIPERAQLLRGPFAGQIQGLMESDETSADVWLREEGFWFSRRIELADHLPPAFWRMVQGLFTPYSPALGEGDVLICNGWIAQRYKEQFMQELTRRGVEVLFARPEAVCSGACIFSRRISNGEPTYYDTLPDYQLWDGMAGKWTSLFATNEPVEPGVEVRKDDIHLLVAKNNDNLSIYVRNSEEATEEEDARRLKVTFASFVTEDVRLELSITVRLARGSAEMVFQMEDNRQKPVFLVMDKPSRTLRFRYTVCDEGMVSGEPEPVHKGRLEPQPVLGRIYDSEDNVRMVKLYLNGDQSPELREAVAKYRRETGFSPTDKLINSRVGYDANPRQPTRGLLGTKRLPNMPEIDKLAHLLAHKLKPTDKWQDYDKWQNYCHSMATDEYKASVRAKLSLKKAQNSWNFYYAPGYVLGEKPGDFELLLGYLIQQRPNGSTTGKLWWSVFRMLCWHPEARIKDVRLLETALWKLLNEDAEIIKQDDRKNAILAILYACRARENKAVDGKQYDFPRSLLDGLVRMLKRGVLANEPFPKTMLPNFQLEGTLSDYVIRFLMKEDVLADRELGAQMGCL